MSVSSIPNTIEHFPDICQEHSLASVLGIIPHPRLVADSAQATGLKWATASSTPSFVGVKCTSTTNTSLSNLVWTAIVFNGEDYDTDNFHSTSSNTSRITIPTGKGGYYRLTGNVAFDSTSSTGARYASFYKNGSAISYPLTNTPGGSERVSATISTTVNLAAGDYVELYGYQGTGGTISTIGWMSFEAHFIGA